MHKNRSFLNKVLAGVMLGVAICVSLCLAGCNTGSGNLPRVLVIVGGHSYDTTEFWDMFRSLEDIQFDSVSHPRALEVLGSDAVDGYDVLVFYDFQKGLDEKDSAIYLNLTEKGMPMVFLHHALGTFQKWEGYSDIVGGIIVDRRYTDDSTTVLRYKHDLDLHIQIIKSDHPVTNGLDDFIIRDEGYANVQIKGGIDPLLGTNHPDSDPIVGWTNQYKNSSVVTFMLGHDRHAYENESFRKLINNAIHWLSSR